VASVNLPTTLQQGKGIPLEKLAQIQSKGSAVGIRGMRERLRQFQGDLIIESNNSGTTVVVTIPISQSLGSADTTESFESSISDN
jgi:signal transduction histidine kinase